MNGTRSGGLPVNRANPRFMAEPKRILALDGGGIRGIFTLQILARIQELFRKKRNQPNLLLADVFDMIAGTSTGAIIAAFLSWRLSVEEIEKLYVDHCEEMFTKENLIRRYLNSKFDSEAIANFFKKRFREKGKAGKDDGEAALLGTERLKGKYLMIVMRNGSTGGSWPVTNNPEAKYNKRFFEDGTPNPDCNLDFPLWQLLRASTAAPTFFTPEEIVIQGNTHLFMDGGITPYNNPALIAVLTATLPPYGMKWTANREELHVISVGTGLVRAQMPGVSAERVNMLDHVRYIAPALIGSVAWEQDFLCRVLGDCVHGGILDSELGALLSPNLLNAQEQKFTYARYDQPLDNKIPEIGQLPGRQIQLDDLEQIPLLKKLGEKYADDHVRAEHFFARGADSKPCENCFRKK